MIQNYAPLSGPTAKVYDIEELTHKSLDSIRQAKSHKVFDKATCGWKDHRHYVLMLSLVARQMGLLEFVKQRAILCEQNFHSNIYELFGLQGQYMLLNSLADVIKVIQKVVAGPLESDEFANFPNLCE